eukprot:COSAG04_NODE_3807_length_2511_cov_2.242537_3_plen_295_part_00
MERLAGEGASADAKDWSGTRPVVWAAQLGRTEVVEALLRLRCDPNAPDASDNTALTVAAARGHGDVVGALLRHDNVYLDAVNNSGGTALVIAAVNSHAAIVRQLVDAGASTTPRNRGRPPPGLSPRPEGYAIAAPARCNGQTALEMAEAKGDAKIAALLGPRGPQPIAAYLAQFPKEERDKWSPSVAIMRRALGCEHPDVLTAMLDIGEVRCKLGRYSEGLALMREATVGMWRVHGQDHWDTTNAVDKMKEQQRQAAVVRKEAAQSRRRGGVVSAGWRRRYVAATLHSPACDNN